MGILHKITFLPRFIRQAFYIRFNRLMFISAGATVGRGFRAFNRIYLKLYRGATLNIGENVTISSGEAINPIAKNIRGCIFVDNHASLLIGDNVGMSSPTIWCAESITICNNVKLGGVITILDTDCHSLNYLDRRQNENDKSNTKTRPVIIEEDVLIGAHSIILKGSHIGARSVIGAGSVVSGTIPPDCIAAGNPCKVIKYIDKK